MLHVTNSLLKKKKTFINMTKVGKDLNRSKKARHEKKLYKLLKYPAPLQKISWLTIIKSITVWLLITKLALAF